MVSGTKAASLADRGIVEATACSDHASCLLWYGQVSTGMDLGHARPDVGRGRCEGWIVYNSDSLYIVEKLHRRKALITSCY